MTSLGGICVPPIFGLVSDASNLDVAGFVISGATLCTALWTVLMVRDVTPVAASADSARAAPVSVSLTSNPA